MHDDHSALCEKTACVLYNAYNKSQSDTTSIKNQLIGDRLLLGLFAHFLSPQSGFLFWRFPPLRTFYYKELVLPLRSHRWCITILRYYYPRLVLWEDGGLALFVRAAVGWTNRWNRWRRKREVIMRGLCQHTYRLGGSRKSCLITSPLSPPSISSTLITHTCSNALSKSKSLLLLLLYSSYCYHI